MRVPGGAGRGVQVDEAAPRRLRCRPTGPKPLPRAIYSIRWADGRLAQYTSVRAYERDCLRGNYPLFQPGVGLTQEEDEGGAVRFLLSENEWRKPYADPAFCEIHFWGGIDFNRDVADGYFGLCAKGFSLVYRDLPGLLAGGTLVARASEWRVAMLSERSDGAAGVTLAEARSGRDWPAAVSRIGACGAATSGSPAGRASASARGRTMARRTLRAAVSRRGRRSRLRSP